MIYLFFNEKCNFGSLNEIVKFYGVDVLISMCPLPKNDISKGRGNKVKYLTLNPEDYNETEHIKGIIELSGGSRIAILCNNDIEICKNRALDTVLINNGHIVVHVRGHEDSISPKFVFEKIKTEFFQRDAKTVAIELLGKLIVRKIEDRYLIGKIVETEAYFGADDPASRAYHGKKNYNSGMWLPGGHIFVYMVHANWMFNITTDSKEAQAVLIRAVEPLVGIDIMQKNRPKSIKELCNGPGKWTRAFGITKEFNGKALGGEFFVADSPWSEFAMGKSKRIGVREDLQEDFRFFIKNSKFLSR